ncbi:MAG: Nif3-like dinuclear metal center hexameric protein [Spirochaetaceae bacterium]|jgi:dinuclear metal center YbgI/SA1388 family protein|nr:Nif3-like dinuclear metal center hexameric protein [Spirochaetaceae bacterium]
MTIPTSTSALDAFFRSLLDIEGFRSIDASLNGLQVDNDGTALGKIAFAVDACLETFKRAAAAGAGMLFVHHGLFWGAPSRLQGPLKTRIQFLLDHNLALYAVHLPLDAHPQWGNNGVLAERLGIANPEPFGWYHGRQIGFKGALTTSLTVDEAARRISFMDRPPLGVYAFGKTRSETCAVISGGAAKESLQAIAEGLDLYVTGEASHQVYHEAQESRLNLIAGGHYATEVWGVRKIMEQCALTLPLETEFIDLPTGL